MKKIEYRNPVRITEVFKRINKHNPISGHSWTEHGETTGYEISGGVFVGRTKCKTLKQAEKAAKEMTAFTEKFGVLVNLSF